MNGAANSITQLRTMCNDAAQVLFASVFIQGLLDHKNPIRIALGLFLTTVLWYTAYEMTNIKRRFHAIGCHRR